MSGIPPSIWTLPRCERPLLAYCVEKVERQRFQEVSDI